ncbi:MAG: DUF1549 domain-containing protein, partial [Candidatus Omnitrophica bacterium]|nr:DUF1549 domain-containing protein [Candidatus Omnitrophota bacterium]
MNGWPSSRPFAVCFLIASLITFGMSTGSSMGLEDNHAEIPNIIESLRAIERSEFPKQEIEDWLRQEEEKTLGEIESIDIEVTDLRNRIESLESARQNFQAKLKASEPSNSLVADSDRNFWSFRRLSKPSQPEVTDPDWARTPIDRFILAGLEERGLSPTPRASKQKLIRRLYFDLIGLPPSPEEVQSFVEDDSPSAYEDLVDRLLDSPHYGERRGRHWLDLARYAESSGKETSFSYPQAWRYRDYVIDSFNADVPFDQFIREQIAGDTLPADNDIQAAEHLVATGFLALGPKSHIERNKKQFELDLVDEQIDAVSQAFLGLTVACARCHDHKFDPIPQADYYALAGIFRSTETLYGTIPVIQNNNPSELLTLPNGAGMVPGVPKMSPRERERLETQIADLRATRAEMAKKKQFATSDFLRNG